MDTSKKYIKMCEKAKEIQKNWSGKVGDLAWRGKLFLPIKNACGYITDVNFKKDKEIWLPRQDQLQEMIYTHPERFFRFYEFLQKHYFYNAKSFNSIKDYSMEQLWLAFVMKEKYNKIWNGKEWIL